jgi:hypothetical protein
LPTKQPLAFQIDQQMAAIPSVWNFSPLESISHTTANIG